MFEMEGVLGGYQTVQGKKRDFSKANLITMGATFSFFVDDKHVDPSLIGAPVVVTFSLKMGPFGEPKFQCEGLKSGR